MKENGKEVTVMKERAVVAEAAMDAIWHNFNQQVDGSKGKRSKMRIGELEK